MKMTKERGITLIALVVTVIVMLILAAVVLHAITGSNSIIDNANNAVQKYSESANGDQDIVNGVENLFEKHLGPIGTNSENSGNNNNDTTVGDDDDDDDTPVVTPIQQQYGGLVQEEDTINQDYFNITYVEAGTAVVRHSTDANGVVSRGDTPTANTERTAIITGINWEYFEDANFTVNKEVKESFTYVDPSTSETVVAPESTSYFCVIGTAAKKTQIEEALRKLIIPYEVTKDGNTYKVTAIDAELLISNKVTFGLPENADDEDEAIVPSLSGTADTSYLIIPANVKSISNMKFLPRDQILLAEGITTIGANAFSNCKDVNLISIPTTIRTIGDSAFVGSSVQQISYNGTIYKTVSSLTSALSSDGVTVAEDAFDGVNLELDS